MPTPTSRAVISPSDSDSSPESEEELEEEEELKKGKSCHTALTRHHSYQILTSFHLDKSARHPLPPRFTLPRETGQVPRSPVATMVIGPGDRGSGGWKLAFVVSTRRRSAASLLTVM
ncbi:hypothetical protein EYF80_003199 [Liparis tanakae]|uniref:Uncharacterized protein n=1 Tax=Liparis tanakae TaxID=230148 RepID=A0A4Z2J8C2_9TELE|nr:hypothetical protein EYF80_003199 [Liparis tanakae]